MRDYEILFIVRPELDDEQVGQAVKSVDTLIANLGGVSQRTDVWGKRRLAYEVDHVREGQYVLTDFQLDPDRLREMEATLKISDTVFRHLIVRKPDRAVSVAATVPESVAPAQVETDTAAPAPVEAETAAPAVAEPEGAAPAEATTEAVGEESGTPARQEAGEEPGEEQKK